MSRTHRFTAELEAGRGGGAMVLVPSEVASALGGLKQMRVVGTVNDVVVTRDDRPRVLEIAAELSAALAANPVAHAAFDRLSITNRKGIAASVGKAKRPETRERRLAAAMARLGSQ